MITAQLELLLAVAQNLNHSLKSSTIEFRYGLLTRRKALKCQFLHLKFIKEIFLVHFVQKRAAFRCQSDSPPAHYGDWYSTLASVQYRVSLEADTS